LHIKGIVCAVFHFCVWATTKQKSLEKANYNLVRSLKILSISKILAELSGRPIDSDQLASTFN